MFSTSLFIKQNLNDNVGSMKLAVLFLFLSTSAHAQRSDGSGYPGQILRAYVKTGASLNETMIPGTEHTRGSEAIYTTADVTEVTQSALRIVGKGVKTRTGEALAFACIGSQFTENSTDPSCDYLRAIYYNPKTKKVFSFGKIYYVGDKDLKTFFGSLKQSAKQVHSPRITYNKFIAFYSEELTSKDGWNWSINPDYIPYRRFLSIVSDLQGATMCYYTHVRGMIFAEMIQPTIPSIYSPWYSPTGGGYGPNGGYYDATLP